jgi:RNA polymerase sigma-70 factor (ECF subfamily)
MLATSHRVDRSANRLCDRVVSVSAPGDDATVIARSLSDSEAFAAIFERHFDEIHRHLRRRYPEEADELAAEVFVVAFDARSRYRPMGDSARPWLYGIASNLLSKRRRQERRALRAHARSGGRRGPAEDDFDDAVDRADAERRSRLLASAVGRLSADDRDTLLLYALSDLSYEEVAFALEVPIGTVRSRLARARRRASADLAGLDREESRDA